MYLHCVYCPYNPLYVRLQFLVTFGSGFRKELKCQLLIGEANFRNCLCAVIDAIVNPSLTSMYRSHSASLSTVELKGHLSLYFLFFILFSNLPNVALLSFNLSRANFLLSSRSSLSSSGS